MASFFVDLDDQPETKEKDISLEEVLQIVKLLKQKNWYTLAIRKQGCVNAYEALMHLFSVLLKALPFCCIHIMI